MNSPTPTGLNRSRVDTRFKLSKYCPRTEPTVENCGSPTLRFGELLDFSLSFWPRHSAAWPAAFQITIKNNAKFSFLEPQRDVFSKRFQGSTVWHLNDNGECSFLNRLGQSKRLGVGKLSAIPLLRNGGGVVCLLGNCAKSLSMHSACGALQKLVQRICGCEDRPSRNRYDDGEKQRFDYKFPTLFARKIAPA